MMDIKKEKEGLANGGFSKEMDKIDLPHPLRKDADDEMGHVEKEAEDTMFEDKEHEGNYIGNKLEAFWRCLGRKRKEHKKGIACTTLVIGTMLYNAYFIAAIHYGVSTQTQGLDYCNDVGFLIILTVLLYAGLFYFLVLKPYFGPYCYRVIYTPMVTNLARLPDYVFSVLSYVVVILAIVIFVSYDSYTEPRRLISAAGLIIIILLGFIFSKHPGYVVWRHVLWGIILQFLFGILILRWHVGKAVFGCIGDKVSSFLSFTDAGSTFVFGYLADQEPFLPFLLNGTAEQITEQINTSGATKFVFMFKILSTIYFFNFCISMLFYLGTMQWIVIKIGWILQVTVGTTACESLNAAANIFLGQSEAPLMIKPYFPIMTKSEIHAVMTGGFATIAGTVLAAYISFGIDASHLLTASVMSAPAALAYAKLLYPETKKSKTTSDNLVFPKSDDSNILDAASNGAMQAVFLVSNIAGSLIAFLAFVSFVNSLLGWFGGLVGAPYISFEYILGLVFYPLAFIMGVDCEPVAPCCIQGTCPPSTECDQCRNVAVLIGLKTIVNEFAAYDRLSEFATAQLISTRSQAIATFALCGFSNPASVGIQIASLTYLAPSRRGDISQVAVRAFVAGSAACFLTACVAGILIRDGDQL